MKHADKADLFLHACRAFAPRLIETESLRREFQFAPPRRWRFDFAWIRLDKLAVEVDGGQWLKGGGRHNSDADREKLNIAVMLGWRVLRFSVQQLERDPAGCIDITLAAFNGCTTLPEGLRRPK